MVGIIVSPNKLSDRTTDELKQEVLELINGRDAEPLKEKVAFFKDVLTPYAEELQRRNPFPVPEDQIPVVLGVWSPVWSTIPFHDTLPGRIHHQSYQIFREHGYYANIARYAPGNQFSFLNRFSALLAAYDFMVMQSFAVEGGQWCIKNIGIEQAFRRRILPLTIDRAEQWFDTVVETRLQEILEKAESSDELDLQKLDSNARKRFEKTYRATPLFEHVYVDHDFRLVKTQREAKQRPSYTIAVRRR